MVTRLSNIMLCIGLCSSSIVIPAASNQLGWPYAVETDDDSRMLDTLYNRLDKLDTKLSRLDKDRDKDKYNDTQQEIDQLRIQVSELGQGLTLSQLFLRAAAGKNWKAMKQFRPENVAQAAAGLGVIVTGNAINGPLEQSIGGVMVRWFDTGLDAASSALYPVIKAYRSIRNKVLGRSGEPLNVTEVEFWRHSVGTLLKLLVKISKNADKNTLRSADKIARDAHLSASTEWQMQVSGYLSEFSFIASCVKTSVGYYSPESDRAIVHYATQLHNTLHAVQKTILEGTNSYRDLGSTDRVTALECHEKTIDQFFVLLINALAPRNKSLAKPTESKTEKRSSIFDRMGEE